MGKRRVLLSTVTIKSDGVFVKRVGNVVEILLVPVGVKGAVRVVVACGVSGGGGRVVGVVSSRTMDDLHDSSCLIDTSSGLGSNVRCVVDNVLGGIVVVFVA